MVDVLSSLLPPCPTITIQGCLLTFLTTLSTGSASSVKEGLQKAIDDLNKEKARLESLTLGYQNAITALNSKINALKAELLPYDAALQAIEDFLSTNVCPELFPIRLLLETLRAFIQAQIDAINVSGLQGLLDEATAGISVIDCFIDALQTMIDNIP